MNRLESAEIPFKDFDRGVPDCWYEKAVPILRTLFKYKHRPAPIRYRLEVEPAGPSDTVLLTLPLRSMYCPIPDHDPFFEGRISTLRRLFFKEDPSRTAWRVVEIDILACELAGILEAFSDTVLDFPLIGFYEYQLRVPYHEKEIAKFIGAFWVKERRAWCISEADWESRLMHWLP